jgi:hypothetical protein
VSVRDRELAAARARRLRHRRANDVGQFKLELPVYPLADTLVQRGHLVEAQMDDHAAVQDALRRWVNEAIGLDP